MIKQITIGRGDDCQIRIPDQSQKVSRNHATLKIYENGKLFITDHSSNGTWVNGVKISQNVEFPVKRGDSISFAHAAELNWEQIPRTKNKTLGYALGALLVVVLVIGGYMINNYYKEKEKLEFEKQKQHEKEEKEKKDREKEIRDVRRADSIRVSQKAIKRALINEQKKAEPEKKNEEKPLVKDTVKKEKSKILIPL